MADPQGPPLRPPRAGGPAGCKSITNFHFLSSKKKFPGHCDHFFRFQILIRNVFSYICVFNCFPPSPHKFWFICWHSLCSAKHIFITYVTSYSFLALFYLCASKCRKVGKIWTGFSNYWHIEFINKLSVNELTGNILEWLSKRVSKFPNLPKYSSF